MSGSNLFSGSHNECRSAFTSKRINGSEVLSQHHFFQITSPQQLLFSQPLSIQAKPVWVTVAKGNTKAVVSHSALKQKEVGRVHTLLCGLPWGIMRLCKSFILIITCHFISNRHYCALESPTKHNHPPHCRWTSSEFWFSFHQKSGKRIYTLHVASY